MFVSIQLVIDLAGTTHVVTADDARDPDTYLEVVHCAKLQNELIHGLEPAIQLNTIDDAASDDVDENVMEDGLFAGTNASVDTVELVPREQLQPSATVNTYALFEATFARTH
jgi:hypothetical protein